MTLAVNAHILQKRNFSLSLPEFWVSVPKACDKIEVSYTSHPVYTAVHNYKVDSGSESASATLLANSSDMGITSIASGSERVKKFLLASPPSLIAINPQ